MAEELMGPGQLIVFEGPDNVGKTTTSKRLVAALRASGKPVLWQSFPGHARGTLGAEIYALHHVRRMRAIDPLSRQLLHVAAHVDLINRHIKPALERGVWVVLDRYWWSAEVYGLVAGADLAALRKIISVEQRVWEPIRPRVAFLISRSRSAHGDAAAVLARNYLKLAVRERRRHPVVIVPNESTIDAMFQKIISSSQLRGIVSQ